MKDEFDFSVPSLQITNIEAAPITEVFQGIDPFSSGAVVQVSNIGEVTHCGFGVPTVKGLNLSDIGIPSQDEDYEAWLQERYNFDEAAPNSGTFFLGATDLSAIMGLNPYSSALSVYSTYRDLIAKKVCTDAMMRGKLMEGYIAKVFEYIYGWPVRKRNTIRHPEYYHLGVSPDYETLHPEYGWVSLEIKSHEFYVRREYGEEWTDDIPHREIIQAVWQAEMMDVPATIVFVAFGMSFKDMKPYLVMRTPELAAKIQEAGVNFLNNHLLPGIPPPPGGTKADEDTIKALYPTAPRTDSVLMATDTINEVAEQFMVADKEADEARVKADALKNQLKDVMGENYNILKTSCGPFTWKQNKDSQKTDWEAVAKSLGATAELVAKYTKTTPGIKQFRPPKG